MGSLGTREILIILLIILLLFGAPKLPQLARSIGQSMKILKDETRSMTADDKKQDQGQDSTDASASSSSDDPREGK